MSLLGEIKSSTTTIAVGDLDNNGYLDIVIGNTSRANNTLLLNYEGHNFIVKYLCEMKDTISILAIGGIHDGSLTLWL